MSFEEAYQLVSSQLPQILYLSGKTSTGKSTFAGRLEADFGYRIIELDQIVSGAVIEPLRLQDEGGVFVEVYRKRDKSDWIELFVAAARKEIVRSTLKGQRVIIDGAVAHPATLKQILADLPAFTFMYFHPVNLEVYERNLTSRFMAATEINKAGLPSRFWKLIEQKEFKAFCASKRLTKGLVDAIGAYARISREESIGRLEAFREHFQDIQLVEL